MVSEFNSLNDMKKFAKILSNELIQIGEIKLSTEINYFTSNTYTTSSEYLGELKFLLERILNKVISLNFSQTDNIKKAITVINQAFE